MNIKQQMKDALIFIPHDLDIRYNEMSDWGYNLWNNFMYGNYSIKDYRDCLEIRNANNRKQKAFVINNYTRLLALEFDCFYGYAQKVLVSLFSKEKLEWITNYFINEINKMEN
jgi:hypothetical protein